MLILDVHHVQITVPIGCEDQARSFYCGLLQLPEIDKPEPLQQRGGLWLCAGGMEIHVGVEDGVNRSVTKAHVAYLVDDMEAFRRRLAAQGIAIIESIPIAGYDRFEFRDPFGNRVELIQRLGK